MDNYDVIKLIAMAISNTRGVTCSRAYESLVYISYYQDEYDIDRIYIM